MPLLCCLALAPHPDRAALPTLLCPAPGFEQLAQKEAAKEEERRSGKRRRGGSDGEDDEEEEEADPEMAALMGFGGFGTSKK